MPDVSHWFRAVHYFSSGAVNVRPIAFLELCEIRCRVEASMYNKKIELHLQTNEDQGVEKAI